MAEELSEIYRVSGTIDFREPMTRERAEAVLWALGAIGVNLEIVPERSGPEPAENTSTTEALHDRYAKIDDMTAFAEQHGTTRELATKAWYGLRRAHSPDSYPSIAHALVYIYPSTITLTPQEQELQTRLSIASLNELITRVDALLARSQSVTRKREILERALGYNIGPKTYTFLRTFAASFDEVAGQTQP